MTYQKQRVAMAELLGAKWMCRYAASHACLTLRNEGDSATAPDWSFCHKDDLNPCDETIPYFDSLDDCQRVFKGLTKNQKESCVQFLAHILWGHGWNTSWWDLQVEDAPSLLQLTPAQWVEAILRATGKWEES
jgi:hypothetical protein